MILKMLLLTQMSFTVHETWSHCSSRSIFSNFIGEDSYLIWVRTLILGWTWPIFWTFLCIFPKPREVQQNILPKKYLPFHALSIGMWNISVGWKLFRNWNLPKFQASECHFPILLKSQPNFIKMKKQLAGVVFTSIGTT